MTEQEILVVETPVSARDYARACVRAWKAINGATLAREAVAVLWAQYINETGGKHCYNWNIGNVKHVAGDGHDFQCLHGVWEGVSLVTAGNLIAAGRAVRDPSADHAKAVGPDRVSVIFPPPQPECQFRAFGSLDEAMRDELVLLSAKRFASAWPFVLAGDVAGFAGALKLRGYFTATAAAYAANMRPAFDAFCRSTAYDDALEELRVEQDATPTVPALPDNTEIVHDIPDTVDVAEQRDE